MTPDTDVCWKCGKLLEEDRIGQNAYCLLCHRELLPSKSLKYSDMTYEQRKKANARSKAGVYKRLGKLRPDSCPQCNDVVLEMHHEDYNKPFEVKWVCNKHHLEAHNKVKRKGVPYYDKNENGNNA